MLRPSSGWNAGGFVAAVAVGHLSPVESVNSPGVIQDALDMPAVIGPLFGILLVDFYLVRKQHIVVEDLYSERERRLL